MVSATHQGGWIPGPLRPFSTTWLAYNGLVLRFGSTYNRAEDLARIFAIISSMQFTPIPEARLRGSDSFDGDENDIRRHIAEAEPIEPPCDFTCQLQEDYNMRMVHLEAARKLPANLRPLVEPIPIGDFDVGHWLTYTHPVLGISIRYDPTWTVADPFAEGDLDESVATGNAINTLTVVGDDAAMLRLPTATPPPTATAMPTVRAAVIPAAQAPALQDELQPYKGRPYYEALTPFKLWYDPQIWALAIDDSGNDYLVHQSIPHCEITLRTELSYPYRAGLPPVTLNSVEWGLSYLTAVEEDYLAYARRVDDFAYIYVLALPTPIPAVYDPEDKNQCQLDAEAVLATHEILPAEALWPTVTAAP